MIKAIVFDVMGVIFTVGDDTNELFVPFVQHRQPKVSKELINKLYKEASLGRMTSEELWRKLGFPGDTGRLEKEYLDGCYTIDVKFIPAATELKERYRLALLSNDISEWSRYLRRKYGIDRMIETAVISGDVGLRKPAAGIYRIVLESLGLPAEECVFIDDSPQRLEAAQKLGMKAILFNRENFVYDGAQINSFAQLPKLLETL